MPGRYGPAMKGEGTMVLSRNTSGQGLISVLSLSSSVSHRDTNEEKGFAFKCGSSRGYLVSSHNPFSSPLVSSLLIFSSVQKTRIESLYPRFMYCKCVMKDRGGLPALWFSSRRF